MNALYGYNETELENLLYQYLIEELHDENSLLNLYSFSMNETTSKEEILASLRTHYIDVHVEGRKMALHCHIGDIDSINRIERSKSFHINYDRFIDAVINHYKMNIIEPCTYEEFLGLTSEEFLMTHFERKEEVNLLLEVQRAKNEKDFKHIILLLMKDNITHCKKTANGGGTGLSLDAYHSFYTGSLFVNDFSLTVDIYECVARYTGVSEREFSDTLGKRNFWKILYDYLLKKSGATLF